MAQGAGGAEACNGAAAIALAELYQPDILFLDIDYLGWVQASIGSSLRMISSREILFLRADEK